MSHPLDFNPLLVLGTDHMLSLVEAEIRKTNASRCLAACPPLFWPEAPFICNCGAGHTGPALHGAPLTSVAHSASCAAHGHVFPACGEHGGSFKAPAFKVVSASPTFLRTQRSKLHLTLSFHSCRLWQPHPTFDRNLSLPPPPPPPPISMGLHSPWSEK